MSTASGRQASLATRLGGVVLAPTKALPSVVADVASDTTRFFMTEQAVRRWNTFQEQFLSWNGSMAALDAILA